MKHTLTIIGLGPGSKEYLTIGALDAMKKNNKILLRTKKHPVVSYLASQGIEYESFDHVYEGKESFDEVYETIVEQLISMVGRENVVYAVPGSPFVAEHTVQILMERQKQHGFHMDFVPSVSFVEAVFHALKKDPVKGMKIIDGLQLDKQMPDVETDTIITQIYNRAVASDAKLKLMDYYPDEYPIVVIRAAGIPEMERIENIMLYELDRIEWLDYLTSIYIPKVENNTVKFYTMNNLLQIMAKLRSKEGCPWDMSQTHDSLRPYLIEETYEVLEALDNKDMILLEEELGDLLLQIVFHATLAAETGEFHMEDVISGICKKLIYRHPHVFGEVKANTVSGALKSWEEMKRKEKDVKTYTDGLRRIPKHLPSLMKSYKLQKKAAEIGFDWDHVEDAMTKVEEELKELLEVYRTQEMDKIKEEIGDLIFAVVNVARFLKVDPEDAVNGTIEKFIERFEFMENNAKNESKNLEEMTLQELDNLWDMAKIHKNKKNDKKYK